ncbi:hypothetical protein QCA50_012652 [Cerrena zonata]|uniref:Uncharacterized protein n=1 Tax=Cerrena zonata TaxID=2478898 RepID=A0AAW0FTF4_9APHY
MRYLLDELSSQESSHHDALCPIQREASRSFNGDHILTSPVAIGEVRELFGSVGREFQRLRLDIEQGKLAPFQNQLQAHGHCSHIHNISSVTYPAAFSTPQPRSDLRTEAQPLTSSQLWQPLQHINNTSSQPIPSRNTGRPTPPIPDAVIPNIPHGPNAWREGILF